MPFGGKYQLSPSEGMAAKIPVLEGETNTATLMTFGYNPTIAKWSPFHSAYLAVVESIAKIVAMGGDYRKVRLTLQEYFEKLGQDPVKWGKPLSALLGALKAQNDFGTPAVGGKDSMSGTFEDLDVPPTVVSFAVCTTDVRKIVSTEFKEIGSSVVFIPAIYTEDGLPDASVLKANFERINALIHESKVLAAHSVRFNGVSEAISRMCFGNKIGINFNEFDIDILFSPNYGGMVLEISNQHNLDSLFEGINYIFLGTTIEQPAIKLYGKEIQLDELIDAWLEPLETVYPINEVDTKDEMPSLVYGNVSEPRINKPNLGSAQPRVLIPIFPGTNGEYDLVDAFSRAGAKVETLVIKNLSVSDLKESIAKLVELIGQSQILAFPGGSSMGGEPDGAAKFIGAYLKTLP